MNILTIAVILLVSFAGAFVQGITGFGSAMVFMSFLPLVIPLSSASAMVPVMLTIIGIQVTIKLFKHINWKTILVPLILSMVSASIGVWIMQFFTVKTMQIILGCFLIFVGIYSFATSKHPIRIKPTLISGGIAGLIAGIFTGLLNIGGPPLAIYYNAATDDPKEFKGNIEFNFIVMYGWTALNYAVKGSYNQETLLYLIPAAIGVIAASFLGLKIYSKFNKQVVSRLVWGMLIVMGLYQLGKAFGIL